MLFIHNSMCTYNKLRVYRSLEVMEYNSSFKQTNLEKYNLRKLSFSSMACYRNGHKKKKLFNENLQTQQCKKSDDKCTKKKKKSYHCKTQMSIHY